MAKSLGQIHVVNQTLSVSAASQKFNVDLPGALTEQLQTMVRCGTFHKVVGIDMTLDSAPTSGGQITGNLLYYAPTAGRCAAFRGAFRSMAEVMKTQGISMRNNPLYDFKVALNNATTVNGFENQATLDGSTGLAFNHTSPGASVFDVHNSSVRPQYTGTTTSLYPEGFDTLLQSPASGGTDFVLNDTIPYTGNRMEADTDYQSIPFTLTFTPQTTATTVAFQWRPDPALYLAVLSGQFQVVIDDLQLEVPATTVNINLAVMVAGWKSIMGEPGKRRSRRSRDSSKKKN